MSVQHGDMPLTVIQMLSEASDLAVKRVDALADAAVACGG
jgi:hypothetical protein